MSSIVKASTLKDIVKEKLLTPLSTISSQPLQTILLTSEDVDHSAVRSKSIADYANSAIQSKGTADDDNSALPLNNTVDYDTVCDFPQGDYDTVCDSPKGDYDTVCDFPKADYSWSPSDPTDNASYDILPLAPWIGKPDITLDKQLEKHHNYLIELQKKINDDQSLLAKEHFNGTYIRDVHLLKDYPDTNTLQENMFRIFKEAKVPLFWIAGIETDPESLINAKDKANAETKSNSKNKSKTKVNDKPKINARKLNKKEYTDVFVLFVNEYVKLHAMRLLGDHLRYESNIHIDKCDCNCRRKSH